MKTMKKNEGVFKIKTSELIKIAKEAEKIRRIDGPKFYENIVCHCQ